MTWGDIEGVERKRGEGERGIGMYVYNNNLTKNGLWFTEIQQISTGSRKVGGYIKCKRKVI